MAEQDDTQSALLGMDTDAVGLSDGDAVAGNVAADDVPPPLADAPAAAGASETGERPPRRCRLWRLAMAVVPVALVVALAGLILVLQAPPAPGVTVLVGSPTVMRELPTLLSDIRPGRRPHFVSATVIVEIGTNEAPLLDARSTQVTEALQFLLRDYERDDLLGRDGALRLRADALAVVNQVLAPERARAVLIKNLLVD